MHGCVGLQFEGAAQLRRGDAERPTGRCGCEQDLQSGVRLPDVVFIWRGKVSDRTENDLIRATDEHDQVVSDDGCSAAANAMVEQCRCLCIHRKQDNFAITEGRHLEGNRIGRIQDRSPAWQNHVDLSPQHPQDCVGIGQFRMFEAVSDALITMPIWQRS